MSKSLVEIFPLCNLFREQRMAAIQRVFERNNFDKRRRYFFEIRISQDISKSY